MLQEYRRLYDIRHHPSLGYTEQPKCGGSGTASGVSNPSGELEVKAGMYKNACTGVFSTLDLVSKVSTLQAENVQLKAAIQEVKVALGQQKSELKGEDAQ